MAPVSRNFQEMRERLRLILTKKKLKCKAAAANGSNGNGNNGSGGASVASSGGVSSASSSNGGEIMPGMNRKSSVRLPNGVSFGKISTKKSIRTQDPKVDLSGMNLPELFDPDDLNSLLKFIEGSGSNSVRDAKKAAKKARQKLKKVF